MRQNGYLALLVGAALLATSAAPAMAQGSGIPVRKDVDRTATTTQDVGTTRTETVSGGDVALSRNMRDENITEHLYAGDSLEIAIAQLALNRAQDQRVRDFASVLVRDHQEDMRLVRELITDEDIGRARHPADTSASHMLHMYQKLSGLTGAAFDREFLIGQVHHHAMDLAMLPGWREAARDDDLEQHLDKLRPILESHRNTAQQIATAMNITVPAMHHNMSGHSGHTTP